MGASLAWLAVKGKSADAVLQELGLRCSNPQTKRTGISGALIPDGWYLIEEGRVAWVASEDSVQRLSKDCFVVTCSVEEHVMVSTAGAWRDGQELWRIAHNENENNLTTAEGDLPEFYEGIREKLESQQAEADEKNEPVDYLFDLPVEVAFFLVNYRHDAELPYEIEFERLERLSFWKQLFRKE